jgi:hypothetical protein
MKKLFFIGILILLIFNIIGCKKNGSSPDSSQDSSSVYKPMPSIYRADDTTTGIFDYTGIAYDTVPFIDSTYPPSTSNYPSGFHTSLKTYTHQVSGQIIIKKLISDSNVIHISRATPDNFDNISVVSGLIFYADNGAFINYYGFGRGGDSVVRASIVNNVLSIRNSNSYLLDVIWNWIQISVGDGKFVNGKWEINYQTSGEYTERIYANPIPSHFLLYGYHTYHIICVKHH